LTLDLARIRSDFPALALTPYGKPLTYLDNAASAQKPRQVLERMTRAYESEYANVHRGLHYLANAATEAYEGAREKVRAFLNAPSADEIIFTKNATEGLNLVASSLGRHLEIGEGDEIILSIMEHHSNIVPWHFWRERRGAVIRWAPVDEDGNFLLDAFEKLITQRTKVVAITQMSNALGTIVPVKEVVRRVRALSPRAKIVIDGSQAAVHLPVDVQEIGCDFYVFTGHKLYGPSGIGVLWGRADLLNAMPPFLGGGEMIREVSEGNVTYGVAPHRFEAGTPSIVPAIGLGAAIDYVNAIGKDAIRAHEDELLAYATERLSALNSISILGRAKEKGAILSFSHKAAHAHDIATVIDRQGVAVRAGTHCTMPLLKRFGVTATCRASFALYNTREDVDRLADALMRADKLFS
jgi:cysteine desulfurase / selenocysteine lyase